MKLNQIAKYSFSFICALSLLVNIPIATASDSPEDIEAIKTALEELDRLKNKIEDLEEIIDDAAGYGEEPYQPNDQVGYITGDEAVDACQTTIDGCIEDGNEIIDGLLDYDGLYFQFPNGI